MPDGDRFEWRLRGKGWRTVFRLMTGGASHETVAGFAGKAVAAYLRGNEELPLCNFVEAVHTAVAAPELPFSPPESALPGTKVLTSRLDDLLLAAGYTEAAQLSQRAALKAFVKLQGGLSVSLADVAKSFAAELSWEITERRCIGIARTEVAERTSRTLNEQMAIETDLRGKIKEMGSHFGAQFLKGKPLGEMRAPNRHAQPLSAENMLNQLLPISIGSVANEN